MKKIKFVAVIKWIAKYLLPAVIGWLEGDSHAVYDLISSIFTFI